MVLTQEELQSLVEVRNRSPHQLLGMHPLGDGSGLIARALLPNAEKVEIQPVHERDKPAFKLKRIPKTDIFEGVTNQANRVYAYDLVITEKGGKERRTRDPYSFLPTLGEADLYLFGKGDERRIYDKLGSQLRTLAGSFRRMGNFRAGRRRRRPLQIRSPKFAWRHQFEDGSVWVLLRDPAQE